MPAQDLPCAHCGKPVTYIGRGRRPRWCVDCRPPTYRPKPPKPREIRTCLQCAKETPRMYCSSQCRRDHKRKLTCADCEKPLWWSPTSLPQGQARCRPCRRARPVRTPTLYPRSCLTCGATFSVRLRSTKVYCSRMCANRRTGMVRAPDDSRSSRKARERDAPGLGPSARKALKDKWVAQGRQCTYCPRPATTLDHVLPLVRGGTNHEGNLTPCCKTCNSAKSGWTVIEWRTGKRLAPMTSPLPWTYDRRRPTTKPAPTGEQLSFTICDVCRSLTLGRTCSYECHRIRSRNKYRERAGIALEAPLRGAGRPRTRTTW